MPGTPPRSYDDITRNTVPEPDSSYRPTADQVRAAYEGERILSSDEQVLHGAVASALASSGLDVSSITAEIDGSRVTLRGRVASVDLLPKFESAVRGVADVGDIVNQLVVDAGPP